MTSSILEDTLECLEANSSLHLQGKMKWDSRFLWLPLPARLYGVTFHTLIILIDHSKRQSRLLQLVTISYSAQRHNCGWVQFTTGEDTLLRPVSQHPGRLGFPHGLLFGGLFPESSCWRLKLTPHPHTASKFREWMDLYLHVSIRIYSAMLNRFTHHISDLFLTTQWSVVSIRCSYLTLRGKKWGEIGENLIMAFFIICY
jgi:hypothetical protein